MWVWGTRGTVRSGVAGTEARAGGCIHVAWSFGGMVRILQFFYYTKFQTGTTENSVVNPSCTHYPDLIVILLLINIISYSPSLDYFEAKHTLLNL